MMNSSVMHSRNRHVRGIGMAGLLACVAVLQGCATAERFVTPSVRSFDAPETATPESRTPTLRVMTLNLAHGRGDAFHQLLQKGTATRDNLDRVSAVLQREAPHVVALQEADGPSYWSGNFHHVDYLAERTRFTHAVDGLHVDGLGLAYGTALLADTPLQQPAVVTFDPEEAATPKGFVVSTIDWPGVPGLQVDVVSLHLEFSSADMRRQQARELIDFMQDRQRPLVVMGDFNTQWQDEGTALQVIAGALGLTAWQPEASGQGTFAIGDKRLDWILVSDGLEFRTHQVLEDELSDHRGVIAELGLGEQLARAHGQALDRDYTEVAQTAIESLLPVADDAAGTVCGVPC